MISVTFDHDCEARVLSIAVKGHAGQAEKGRDIVCASASILLYTVARFVKNLYELGAIEREPTVILHEGDALVCCRCGDDDEVFAEALQTYEVIRLGYTILSQNYPQYVRLMP